MSIWIEMDGDRTIGEFRLLKLSQVVPSQPPDKMKAGQWGEDRPAQGEVKVWCGY